MNSTENTCAQPAARRSILPNAVSTHPEAQQGRGRELPVGELVQEEAYPFKGTLNEPSRGLGRNGEGSGRIPKGPVTKRLGVEARVIVAKANVPCSRL